MTTDKLSACLLIAALTLALPGMGAPNQSAAVARYQLFNHCRPVRLLVAVDFDQPVFDDLKAHLPDLAEAKLRQHRLYAGERRGVPLLYVDVDGYSLGFSVIVSYSKWLPDPATDTTWLAATWRLGSVGVVDAQNKALVTRAVSRQLDVFIEQYLRINGGACAGKK